MVATRERTRGRAVLELADPDDPTTRFTLWPGLPPPEGPLHPSLAPRILSGRAQGDPIWLEARPPGAPLNHIAALLEPMHVAMVLQDCCEGLAALHDAGRVHGDIKSKRVVLGEGGYATLVGVGQRQAHPEEDLAALIRLGRTLCGEKEGLALPDVAPASAEVLHELLSRQLEDLDQDALRDELAVMCVRERAIIPEEPTMLQVVVEHFQGDRGRVDELLPILGPETERTGSQISWSGSGGEVTRESHFEATQADIEGTGAIFEHADLQSRRTQLLARILAPVDRGGSTARLPGELNEPCAAVRALVFAGPIDPLPLSVEVSDDLPRTGLPSPSRDVSVTQSFRRRDTWVEREPAEPDPNLAPATRPAQRGARWGARALWLILIGVAFLVGMVAGSALLYLYGPF